MKKLILFALVGLYFPSMAGDVKTSEKSKSVKSLKEMREIKLKSQLQDKQLRRTVSFSIEDAGGKGPKTCKNGSGKCSSEE